MLDGHVECSLVWYTNGTGLILKRVECDTIMIPEVSVDDPKIISTYSQNGPKMIPQQAEHDTSMEQKRSQNDLKLIPERSKADPRAARDQYQNEAGRISE